MSLREKRVFIVRCDRCDREEECGPPFGIPFNWYGPATEDGYHLCDLCVEKGKTELGEQRANDTEKT